MVADAAQRALAQTGITAGFPGGGPWAMAPAGQTHHQPAPQPPPAVHSVEEAAEHSVNKAQERAHFRGLLQNAAQRSATDGCPGDAGWPMAAQSLPAQAPEPDTAPTPVRTRWLADSAYAAYIGTGTAFVCILSRECVRCPA